MESAVDSGNWLEFSRTNEIRKEHRRRHGGWKRRTGIGNFAMLLAIRRASSRIG